jgi:hypothetical protein
MHCIPTNSSLSAPNHDSNGGGRGSSPAIDSDTDFDALFHAQHPDGETPAWEACGRIVEQERADFLEFVACNVMFAGVALVILGIRSRRLHALQARQLAARIGMVRNGPGGALRRWCLWERNEAGAQEIRYIDIGMCESWKLVWIEYLITLASQSNFT